VEEIDARNEQMLMDALAASGGPGGLGSNEIMEALAASGIDPQAFGRSGKGGGFGFGGKGAYHGKGKGSFRGKGGYGGKGDFSRHVEGPSAAQLAHVLHSQRRVHVRGGKFQLDTQVMAPVPAMPHAFSQPPVPRRQLSNEGLALFGRAFSFGVPFGSGQDHGRGSSGGGSSRDGRGDDSGGGGLAP
jgi:hypothetical protein